MKVSLVSTVHNEAGNAAALIDAVRRQSRPPDEWIVIDGGSSDDTARIFASAPTCTLRVAPGGISHGRNLAIAMARHPVVAVIDGGCLPDPEWLQRLLRPIADGALSAEVSVGATEPHLTCPFDAAQWIVLDQFVSYRSCRKQPAASSRSLAFRREVWEAVAYPEWLEAGEDTWLIDRWRRLGRRIVRVDDAVVRWDLPESLAAARRQHVRHPSRGDLVDSGSHGRNERIRLGGRQRPFDLACVEVGKLYGQVLASFLGRQIDHLPDLVQRPGKHIETR